MANTALEQAFDLFDQYQKTKSEQKQLSIVRKLYNLGYIIRPLNTLIIGPTDFDTSKTEHLNPGSNEWGLVDMHTRRPVKRPVPGEEPEQLADPTAAMMDALKKRMTMLQEKLHTAHAILQEYRDPETNEDRGNACKDEIEQLGFILISKDNNTYLTFGGRLFIVTCRYTEHKEREGVHQCPKCKHWYCEECREMFLPIDPMFPNVETAKMCSQCHYDVYGSK